ncbi:hypothetical protein Nepgr_019731 [Nepenthes gracilis]|uniref:Uncharacterized protein n=1 Tax=Nepenthes gracilis TaxID=150966 RepID=A0AAD3SVJ8_NEPGR|nr:hypothetical protein Nepgr_019731 [Nepenthes gracilis]
MCAKLPEHSPCSPKNNRAPSTSERSLAMLDSEACVKPPEHSSQQQEANYRKNRTPRTLGRTLVVQNF